MENKDIVNGTIDCAFDNGRLKKLTGQEAKPEQVLVIALDEIPEEVFEQFKQGLCVRICRE